MDKKKNKKFKLFDLTREGKGISKNVKELEPSLKRFFISYKNDFGKLVSTNILFVLGNFPLIFLIATFSGLTKYEGFLPLSDLFQNINGIIKADGGMTPYKLSLYAIEGLQSYELIPSTLTYVFYALGGLTLFTFGIVNVGTAYIIRNLVSGEPVFVWTDFWYAVRRNWKQALPFGVLDALINVLLIFNIYTQVFSQSSFVSSVFFWSNLIIFIFYFFMRYYIYVQMVTFDLKIFKILKNSLIFSLLGFKRNITALIGIILVLILEVLFTFGSGGVLLPVAVAAPLAVLFSTFAYMKVYASYYKIKEIMIDPYYEEHPELIEKHDDTEIIMKDDVTERERIEEIKKKNSIE